MSTITPPRPSTPAPRPGPPRQRGRARFAAARTIDPFRVIRRYMAVLVATGFTGIFLGVVLYILLGMFYPRYSGEVLFEVRSGLHDSRDITTGDITHSDLVQRLASTETMLLMSRGVVEAAVKEPDVQTTRWFREKFIDPTHGSLIDEAVDELEEDISRRLIQGTNLFGIGWSTADPADVPIVLNSISRAYLEKRRGLDEDIYNKNIEVFKTELNDTTRRLEDLTQEIEAFIREKGITTLSDPRSNQLGMAMEDLVERIANTAGALNLAQSTYVQTAAKLEGTVSPSDEDRALAEEDPTVRPHESAVLQAKTAIRELRQQYRDPDHFVIKKAEARLSALQLEYEAKIEEIMRDNLKAQLNSQASMIERMKNMADELEQEYEDKGGMLRTLAADMSRYLEMEQQRDHLLAVRDTDFELIKEVRLMRLRADASRVRLAQPALTPRLRSFPKIELVLPLTTIALLGLVTGLVFLRELTDQRVKSASDLDVLPEARVLGVIPELQEDPTRSSEVAELVVVRSPSSVLAESYRQACALIDKAMNRDGHQTLLLVGGLPGSGTTTVATNIAASAAASGRSVVILDANFRRPRIAAAMGTEPDGRGLGDVLAEQATIEEVVQRAEGGIDVITAGRPANRVFERLNDSQFDSVMARLRHRYDLVLVDAPPAVVAGDALVLANRVDAAVLVVRAYQEQRGLVARLINQLIDAQCELIGIVLNRPRGTAGGYFKKNFAAMAKYAAPLPETGAGEST